MENKNKSQYDWFKGPQALKQNKDFKQRAKDGLKWAKIFSYVALFTFSMFGCVQVFTVTTDNAVGRGVEIFTNESEIAPSIASTKFTKTVVHMPEADGTKNDAPSEPVYFSTTTPISSIWVNKHSDSDLLEEIHEHVEESQDVAMKDAYKGINVGIVNMGDDITTMNYKDITGKEVEVDFQTSVTDDLGFDDELLSKDSNGKVMVYSSAAETFEIEDELNPSTDISFYIPVEVDRTWDATVEAYKPVYGAKEISIDSSNLDGEDLARSLMSINFLESYFGKYLDSPLFEFLASQDEVSAAQMANDEVYLDDWDAEDTFYVNSVQNYRVTILSQLLVGAGFKMGYDEVEYTGGSDDGTFEVIDTIEYQEGRMIGYVSESSKWRPITTWGEAFSLGPFYGFFVYPIGYITSSIVNGMGDLSGWESMMTIFLVVFSIRMLTFALSYKSTMAQSRMQDLNGKKAIIEAKYTQYEGNKQMEMRKRQEVADLYKKNGINPMASLGTMFLTMPFFLAIWRVIGGIPHLKAASWLGITFSATSYQEFFAGQWQYLPLMLIAASIQLFSQLYPRLINRKKNNERLNAAQKEAMKKANKTQNITMGVFVFMSIIFTAGIQIYWIIGGLWRIVEVRITHHLKEKDKAKRVK